MRLGATGNSAHARSGIRFCSSRGSLDGRRAKYCFARACRQGDARPAQDCALAQTLPALVGLLFATRESRAARASGGQVDVAGKHHSASRCGRFRPMRLRPDASLRALDRHRPPPLCSARLGHLREGVVSDRVDALVAQLATRPGLRSCSARPAPSIPRADWSGQRLKALAIRLYPFAGMRMRELVREWKRNGRTTVRMWLAPEKVSGSRYPTPEFVEWLFCMAKANCLRCGIELPEAA